MPTRLCHNTYLAFFLKLSDKFFDAENMPISNDIAAWSQRREHKPQECAPGEDPKGTGEDQRVP